MKSPSDALGDSIDGICEHFSLQVKALACGDINIDRAVATNALREATWYLLEQFPDHKSDLADMLEVLSELVRNHELEEVGGQI